MISAYEENRHNIDPGEKIALYRALRRDPAKFLFGNKAKRLIARAFMLVLDGEISYGDVKKVDKLSERDLINAFTEFTAVGILEKEKVGRMVRYRINTKEEIGEGYLKLIYALNIMRSIAVEKEEELLGYL